MFLRCFHSYHIWPARWEGGVDRTLQSQQALDAGSFSRSTSVRLRCRAVWRPDTVQPLYVSVQCRNFTRYPRRGEQICMSDHVCTHHLPRLCGASHIDAFWMVCPLSLAIEPGLPDVSATATSRPFRNLKKLQLGWSFPRTKWQVLDGTKFKLNLNFVCDI